MFGASQFGAVVCGSPEPLRVKEFSSVINPADATPGSSQFGALIPSQAPIPSSVAVQNVVAPSDGTPGSSSFGSVIPGQAPIRSIVSVSASVQGTALFGSPTFAESSFGQAGVVTGTVVPVKPKVAERPGGGASPKLVALLRKLLRKELKQFNQQLVQFAGQSVGDSSGSGALVLTVIRVLPAASQSESTSSGRFALNAAIASRSFHFARGQFSLESTTDEDATIEELTVELMQALDDDDMVTIDA